MDVDDRTSEWVEQLHCIVDELAAAITRAHGEKITCRAGCSGCCADGLTIFEIEGAVIARRYPEVFSSGVPSSDPHEEGACAMLDAEGRCRVYDARPYVCRTQGLPLRWLEDGVEARDVCPQNLHDGAGLEDLPPEACWTIGPIERRLAERQEATDGGQGRRVALRDLFVSDPRAASRPHPGSERPPGRS